MVSKHKIYIVFSTNACTQKCKKFVVKMRKNITSTKKEDIFEWVKEHRMSVLELAQMTCILRHCKDRNNA